MQISINVLGRHNHLVGNVKEQRCEPA